MWWSLLDRTEESQASPPKKTTMSKVLTVWLLNFNLSVVSCTINKNFILIHSPVLCLQHILSTRSKWNRFNLERLKLTLFSCYQTRKRGTHLTLSVPYHSPLGTWCDTHQVLVECSDYFGTIHIQVPTKDLRKQMGWIPENAYMPFSYFAVKRAQWLMREDLLFKAFFLLPCLICGVIQ